MVHRSYFKTPSQVPFQDNLLDKFLKFLTFINNALRTQINKMLAKDKLYIKE